ncbi:MAG: hypothetical protein ACFHVJ_10080 [Aestuariibacter sp.]
MKKLNVEIDVGDQDPMKVLEGLSIARFGAFRVLPVPGSDTYNIDGGLNDIRALVLDQRIQFLCRYDQDQLKYEKMVREHCKSNTLNTLELSK